MLSPPTAPARGISPVPSHFRGGLLFVGVRRGPLELEQDAVIA